MQDIEIVISKSKYVEWVKKCLNESTTLEDLRNLSIIPEEMIESGYNEAFEVIEDESRFPQLLSDGLDSSGEGASHIKIRWID